MTSTDSTPAGNGTVLDGGDSSAGPQRGPLRLAARLRTAAPKDYLLHEGDYGAYEREYELPAGFDGPVSASLGNGQLAVRVERAGDRGDAAVTVQPATAGADT